MCRHLAYLGPEVPLADIVLTPIHSLLQQAYAPQRQYPGAINADGFGVGWYVDGDPSPARYRRDIPIWTDPNLVDLGRVIRAKTVLAAVRLGTVGLPFGPTTPAPFSRGRYLFSLNGRVNNWPSGAAVIAEGLSLADVASAEAPTDAALLWQVAYQLLLSGETLPRAMVEVVRRVALVGGVGNLLITDGESIVATTYGHSLSWRFDHRGMFVASEPIDEGAGWIDVLEGSLLVATELGATVTPLPFIGSR